MNYDGVKVCSVPDSLGGDNCLWPFLDVTVYAEGMLGGIDLREAVEQAINGWNDVCNLRLSLTTNSKTSHITITKGSIDGPQGTLAFSELPCGFTKSQWRRLQQQYDTGEMWTIAENPPGGRIDAVRVICHEIGHAIGISHIAPGNLMAPTYSAAIRWPQRQDILEAVGRYGKPAAAPSPAPTPTNPTTPIPTPETGGAIVGILKTLLGILKDFSPEERKELIQLVLMLVKAWRGIPAAQRTEMLVMVESLSSE